MNDILFKGLIKRKKMVQVAKHMSQDLRQSVDTIKSLNVPRVLKETKESKELMLPILNLKNGQ